MSRLCRLKTASHGDDGKWAYNEIVSLRKQRDELLAVLEGLADDIQSLIGESYGVSGLHMNGDIAPWDELESGGRFERLTHLPCANAAITRVKGEQ